jgi:DNA replication and repair protein RecF
VALENLKIQGFRCLTNVELELDPARNLISGANASGKTSLLEAVFFLSRARSFRTAYLDQLVQDGAGECVVAGRIRDVSRETSLGVRCTRSKTEARIAGEPVKSLAELAQALPVQVIDPDIHKLLEEGPARRRRFLDWGVFHVEPGFLGIWRRYQKALRQRNAALRQSGDRKTAKPWEIELVEAGNLIHDARVRQIEALQPAVASCAEELLGASMELDLRTGWGKESSFQDALEKSWVRDRQYQATQVGPHRADLSVRFLGKGAKNRVSRGQQKMLASALLLGQLDVLKNTLTTDRILLVDDPAAELDQVYLQRLMAAIQKRDIQLLITALAPEIAGLSGDFARFHVEQGNVSKVV